MKEIREVLKQIFLLTMSICISCLGAYYFMVIKVNMLYLVLFGACFLGLMWVL